MVLGCSGISWTICKQSAPHSRQIKKVKVARTWLPSVGFRSWFRFLAVSLQVTWVGCYYFPPGLQLRSQPLRWLLPVSLLGEQRHDGCEQFDCYPTASRLWFESRPFCAWVQHANQLTTRLPNHPTPKTHHSIFTGRVLFLMLNQQCQRTEGRKNVERKKERKNIYLLNLTKMYLWWCNAAWEVSWILQIAIKMQNRWRWGCCDLSVLFSFALLFLLLIHGWADVD